MIVDELHQILVGAHHRHLVTVDSGLLRQGTQHIVGLVALELHDRDPIGLEHPSHPGDLRLQILGHRRPIGLVLRIHLVAHRRPREIEGDAEQIRLILFEELAQHGDEAIDGVGGKALGVLKP